MIVIKKTFFIGYLAFSLLFSVVLSIESFLNLEDNSLCHTSACDIVGNYIHFGDSVLTTGGAVFFWILSLVFFFAYRYPKQLNSLPLLLLLPALAFDGALLGFQFMTIKQQCLLCITVAVILIIISSLYCSSRQSKTIALAGLLIWFAGFAASSLMIMPEPQNAFSRMILYTKHTVPPQDKKTHHTKMTLVFSMHCPHCHDVIEYLMKQNGSTTHWQIASIDIDADSISKLSNILSKTTPDKNIFKELFFAPQKTISSDNEPSPNIKKRANAARSFLSNLGLTAIPVLVVEENGSKTIITGSHKIIPYLEHRK